VVTNGLKNWGEGPGVLHVSSALDLGKGDGLQKVRKSRVVKKKLRPMGREEIDI